ncbi:MAG TPA: glycosyltransferase family 2 protein [Arachnia sp.]|nr:glycosyltransferase family 2 protein [Arachnia sp.]
MRDERFSVVIPTLQRSRELWTLVEQCAAHPLVGEVLVINNAPEPLSWESPKVRVLQQSRNIFVNPAWNLGAREARYPFLAFVNDDVRFGDEVFDECARVLRRGLFAMVGPDHPCFEPTEYSKPISHRVAPEFNLVFGTFMCLRREDYVPIPDKLRIWGGDDFLFWGQHRPNAVLVRTRFRTEMSTTSSDPEFMAWRERERQATLALLVDIQGARWWHRWGPVYSRMHRRGLALRGALEALRIRRARG